MDENYGTLSESINALIKLGYTHDFNIQDECLICHKTNIRLSPIDFKIDKVYRFEGASDPDDQSILYAISSDKYDIKGTLVNSYGIYADEKSSKLVELLKTHQSNNIFHNVSNDPTPLRPEGNQDINARIVEMDIQKSIDQIRNEITWSKNDRNSITILKTETLRIVLIGMHKDAEMTPHKANGVINVQVLEGKINFTTEQQSLIIEVGHIIALQPNITHSLKAMTESFFLLTLAMNNN